MTTVNEKQGHRTTTEELYIGFRKRLPNLEAVLAIQNCTPLIYKNNTGREPGNRYRQIDVNSGGGVYLLYQEGIDINATYFPERYEGNIIAVLKLNITTGIISSSNDRSLVDMRDSLVVYLLDTYGASAGAFVYILQSAAKQETA